MDDTSSIEQPYQVQLAWAPAFELLVSLRAYLSRAHHKTLDLGSEWVRAVRNSLSPEHSDLLAQAREIRELSGLDLLVRQAPDELNAGGFIRWLAERPTGELYERLEPHVLRAADLRNLGGMRDRTVEFLAAWNEAYFTSVDPDILTALRDDAAEKQALLQTTSQERVVEIATNGVQFRPTPLPRTVLLIPQYHFRPWNLFDTYRDLRTIMYPAEILSGLPGEPPARLLRLTRALSDESRLRILQLLASAPRTFTELVAETGLSKSTIHHHMVILRAAGLVLVGGGDKLPDVFSLRLDSAVDVTHLLRAYLRPEEHAT